MRNYLKLTMVIAVFSVLFSFNCFAANTGANTQNKQDKYETYDFCYLDDDDVLTFSDNGVLVNGIIEYQDDEYYAKNGHFVSNWRKYKTDWYYFDEDDYKMEKNKWIDNYRVDSDGKMVQIR